VARRARAYKSEKRRKEVVRQKKQQEKRERRFKKDAGQENEDASGAPEHVDGETVDGETKE
jgi:hypothetical protein